MSTNPRNVGRWDVHCCQLGTHITLTESPTFSPFSSGHIQRMKTLRPKSNGAIRYGIATVHFPSSWASLGYILRKEHFCISDWDIYLTKLACPKSHSCWAGYLHLSFPIHSAPFSTCLQAFGWIRPVGGSWEKLGESSRGVYSQLLPCGLASMFHWRCPIAGLPHTVLTRLFWEAMIPSLMLLPPSYPLWFPEYHPQLHTQSCAKQSSTYSTCGCYPPLPETPTIHPPQENLITDMHTVPYSPLYLLNKYLQN